MKKVDKEEKLVIKEKIYKYLSSNILFISYLILSLLIGLFLRMATLGGHIYFKALLGDAIIVLLTGSFAYLMKPKSRFTYYFIWMFFYAAIAVANTIYYQFYSSFISVNLLATASMIGEVNDSLFAKLHFVQFLYLLIPILFIFINKLLTKKNYYELIEILNNNSKNIFKKIYMVIGVIVLIILSTFTLSDGSKFIKQWNREYLVQKYGLYIYTINDLIQSVQPRINTLFGYDEAALKYKEYYSCKWDNKKNTNEYTNIFKGKNVMFIHMESIQNFLVDLKINDKEVTPNINKLAHSGIYFTRFYPQISIGTSSDTEFTLLTGLMPSSSGTVFVNYYDRTYMGMPSYFNDLGYYTFSTHANNREYWNRNTMHKALGYKDFIAKDNYIIPEDETSEDLVGLGLGDKAFFSQFTDKLVDIKNNNSPYFSTVITLSNHSPFNDLEKYGEFDVTMHYEYVDDSENKIESVAPYLDGTTMGNYLKSAHYADEAIGEFIKLLKQKDLLSDTIFIFYGDHEARISKKEFNLLYNYDPVNDDIISEDDEKYISMENYTYDLLKNTPLIIWNPSEEYNKEVNSAMGMYDVLPTIANMFGFNEKYSLGHDIFSNNEKIVVFPNGNVLTDKVYYSALNEEYIAFSDEPIDSDYIERLDEYANEILDVSNGIVMHNLIKMESDKVGACEVE